MYRTIELAQGYHGKLATSEGFFYGLDTLPLFIAIAIYLPFWPGRYIPEVVELKEMEMEAARNASSDKSTVERV